MTLGSGVLALTDARHESGLSELTNALKDLFRPTASSLLLRKTAFFVERRHFETAQDQCLQLAQAKDARGLILEALQERLVNS